MTANLAKLKEHQRILQVRSDVQQDYKNLNLKEDSHSSGMGNQTIKLRHDSALMGPDDSKKEFAIQSLTGEDGAA